MLSVLIVNWNTRELLAACLRSIERFPSQEPTEVIVVDNASKDDSAAMVADKFPDIKLIANAKNVGYAAGNNDAFAHATGEWLLTLNPDTELTEGALDVAVEKLRSHPKVGVVAVRLRHPDGRTQASVRGFPTLRGLVSDLFGGNGPYRLSDFDYDREQPAPQPMGTFLMFRREALAAIGSTERPFDEGFPIFFNEVDLLYRLEKSGWSCLYSPDAAIIHHGGESTKQVRKSMIWESHRSLLRFLRKHRLVGLSTPIVAAGLWLAALVRARGYDGGFRP